MGSIPPELSLDCRPTYIPKTISEFLGEVSTIGDVSERLMRLDDYINRLQEEMRKIDAFKRELPLCMLLLDDAIVAVKEEAGRCKKSTLEPILEEFIPLKKSSDEHEKENCEDKDCKDNKKNWLSSVQLWNSDCCSSINLNCDKQNSTPDAKKMGQEVNQPVTEDLYGSCKNRIGGWPLISLKGYSSFSMATSRKKDKEEVPAASLSLVTPGIKSQREILASHILSSKSSSSRPDSSITSNHQANLRTSQQLAARKQRRCWSPELHKRFVNALQQLGGSQAATPKQIRELMQVDGLTNDEVKSHLQKYRLHIRRVPSSTTSRASQSIALGGLWMHQDQCNESSKQSNSQSGSPPGPLHLDRNTSGDSMDDEEDDKSESHSWKSHIHTSVKAGV